MIRTLRTLLPDEQRRHVVPYLLLTLAGITLRAAAALALFPLITALLQANPGLAWASLGILTAATALGWACDAAAAHRAYELGFALLDKAQHTIAQRITEIRLEWFTADNIATTRRAVATTGPELVGLIAYLVAPLLNALLLPAMIALGLLWFSPALAIAALISLPLLLGALALSMQLTRAADSAAERAHAQLSDRLLEFARTQQALRAARQTATTASHIGRALTAGRTAMGRLLALRAPAELIFALCTHLTLITLTAIAVSQAVTGAISPAVTIALIVIIVRFLEPLTLLAELTVGLQITMGAVRTISTVLDAPLQPTGSAPLPTAGAPRIELENVSFNYGGTAQRQVVTGLTITFEPGSTTAIVGPSGAGKSTLLYLLAGLYQPTAGHIRVNGTDLATLSPTARRDLITMVFQDPYLFDASVLDNIRIGHPTASPQQLTDAAHRARVDSFAAQLDQGLESPVGEGGKRLSGGQCQRVAIARALAKPAPLLLVDEATSALDSENERAVADALSSDSTPRTRIIVAHRLSSIQQAHRVIFFENGQIVEDGSIEELLARKGRFAAYWEQHTAASAWQVR